MFHSGPASAMPTQFPQHLTPKGLVPRKARPWASCPQCSSEKASGYRAICTSVLAAGFHLAARVLVLPFKERHSVWTPAATSSRTLRTRQVGHRLYSHQ